MRQCYYLMSFDQNMILDATTGSIARFVNHSCSPNCRMIKWIVSGVPRMALFAGDGQIQTGDELTYDYNFDPFSAKNVQKCLCGSDNCRGVLGPKTRKDPAKKAAAAAAAKDSASAKTKAGKRKVKDLLNAPDDESETGSMKKRKLQAGDGLKRSLSSASLKVAQGAAKLKRSVSAITVTTTKAAVALMTGSASTSTSGTPRSGKGSIKKSVARRASTSTLLSKVMKNKGSPRSRAKTSPASSATKRNSASTLKSEIIVAATPTGAKGSARAAKTRTPSSRTRSGKGEIVVGGRESATGSPRSRKPSAKALAAAADEIMVASPALKPTPGGGVTKNRKTTSPGAKTKAVASKLTRTKSMRQTLVSAFTGARKTTGSWRRKSVHSTTDENDAYAIPTTPEPEEMEHEPAPMPRSPSAASRSGLDMTARYAQIRLVPKDDDKE